MVLQVSSRSGADRDAKNGVKSPADTPTPLKSAAATGDPASSEERMENRRSSRNDACALFSTSNALSPDTNSSCALLLARLGVSSLLAGDREPKLTLPAGPVSPSRRGMKSQSDVDDDMLRRGLSLNSTPCAIGDENGAPKSKSSPSSAICQALLVR